LQLSDIRDLDIGSGRTAYHRVSLIDLYQHTKFRSNQDKLCGWMDVHIDVHMDRRTAIETGFINPTQRSRPKKKMVTERWQQ